MPVCSLCKGIGVVPVGGVMPPYRPCPDCRGSGYVTDEELDRKQDELLRRESKKDRGFGSLLIVIGALIIYFGVPKMDNSTDQLIAIIIAVAFLLYGGKQL